MMYHLKYTKSHGVPLLKRIKLIGLHGIESNFKDIQNQAPVVYLECYMQSSNLYTANLQKTNNNQRP